MEIELKLLIEPSDKQKLRAHPLLEKHASSRPMQDDLVAHYFDTPDLHIRRHEAGLRVRKVRGEWVQTMKAGGSVQGGLHQRHEWETPVVGERPDLAKLRDMLDPASEWAALLTAPSLAHRLVPLFSVRVKRTTWHLHIEDNDIELVLDEGTIERDGNTVPVSEIELELKAGKPECLYDFALRLLQDVPLRLGNQSKAARGYALCSPVPVTPVKAKPLALSSHYTVEQGMQAILANCIAHIQDNEAGVTGAHQVESLHQMRVGLRRLRSALKLFETVAPCPDELQADLKWLGGALGGARDWDVLFHSTLPRIRAEIPADMAGFALQARIAETVEQQRTEACKALLSPRYTRLLLSLFAWMQGTRWRTGPTSADLHTLDGPLTKFARMMIDRGHRKILRRGKQIQTADAPTLHRLRIAGKKNRYAMEFFQSLYPAKRVRRYIDALSALQDVLGWRNDVSVADGLLQQLPAEQAEVRAAAGFVRGYLLALLKEDRRALRKTWKKFQALALPFKA